MHRNSVARGLVASPEDWRWGSYRSYAYGEPDWSGSTTGRGGRRFAGALAEGREGISEKPHFSQTTREMGLPGLDARHRSGPPAAGSIAAHPCKKRKDGAPSVGMVQWRVAQVLDLGIDGPAPLRA